MPLLRLTELRSLIYCVCLQLTENLEYLDRAEKALQSFSTILEESPTACPSLFVALDHYRHGFCIAHPKAGSSGC
jgi:uncharacterized protein YyaL (SSP411 family)